MRLRSLRLFQFRNVKDATISCDHARVFFEGPNGQGKTNLLEAVSFLHSLRSFRVSDRSILIENGAESSSVQARWDHDVQGDSTVSIILEKRARRVSVDGEPVRRLSSYIGQFPSVTMASQDIQLIRGGPAERRRFLDMVIAGTSIDYLNTFQRFQKTLIERNQLLKRGRTDAELAAFDKVWVPTSFELTQMRAEVIDQLGQVMREIYADLADGQETPSLEYIPSIQVKSESEWNDLVKDSHERDRIMGATQRGPQRDDLRLMLDGQLAASHGSEGQQRGLVLALRFAELRWVYEQTGRLPVLLADDILAELDPARRERFWRLSDRWADLQILATGTEFPNCEDSNGWKRFTVSDGSYREA
ncbi:MAG: DNA replication and repair protein RecF [Verrucomicrobiota bacterium]